jgi:hypothetical protein
MEAEPPNLRYQAEPGSRINNNQRLTNPAVSPIHPENHAPKSAKRAGLLRTQRQSIVGLGDSG